MEVISLKELGRPRIDVTVRISGFFRDAFHNLVLMMDDAFHRVARLDEPEDSNFIRKHYAAEVSDKVARERTLNSQSQSRFSGYSVASLAATAREFSRP